jgi:phage terminase large subunit
LLKVNSMNGQPISILLFADSILGIKTLYDWQAQILLNYEAGNQTAAACANFTGKTSTVFPIAALWTLYNFPRARVMYLSATGAQVRNQFFACLDRFRSRPALAGYQWLETEVRNPHGGFLFGRATDAGGHLEGIHNQVDSPAALLVDEAKSIADNVLDALERCTTSYRLFMSSTGAAFGGFYSICTAKTHRWKTFRIPSSMCPHVDPAAIEADRENLKDSVFRIKHGAEWLYDAGDSMISLEHIRALIDNPPTFAPGPTSAFCDFAGAGDESVLATCNGNRAEIVDAWRSRDTMQSVGKLLTLFRKLNLQGYQIGGDEGYGHQLMDRLQEEGFFLQRINNGSPAKRADIYFNLSAEWWSSVGQLIERRQITIPNEEKLIAQLTSRRKLYDSKGRERLESKADLKARGVESPDRADALIGAVMMRLAQDQFAFDPIGQAAMNQMLEQSLRLMERQRPVGYEPFVDWNSTWL